MAKVGNEARLILRLAREKHERLKENRKEVSASMTQYLNGYERCFNDVWIILYEVITSLEK